MFVEKFPDEFELECRITNEEYWVNECFHQKVEGYLKVEPDDHFKTTYKEWLENYVLTYQGDYYLMVSAAGDDKKRIFGIYIEAGLISVRDFEKLRDAPKAVVSMFETQALLCLRLRPVS